MSSMHMSDARKFEFVPAAAPLGTKTQHFQNPVRGRQNFSTFAHVAMFVVALIGVGLSCYLSWAALTSSKVAGCGSGQVFDCSHVLQSKWSTVFGIPVGVPAAAVYLTVLAALTVDTVSQGKRIKQVARMTLALCAFAAAFSALWFIFLQLFVVEHLCQYCLGAHACSLVLAGLVVWNLALSKSKIAVLSALGIASVAVLATSQVMAEPPKTYEIETFAIPVETNDEPGVAEDFENLFSAPGFDSEDSTTQPDDQSLFEAPGSTSEPDDPEVSLRAPRSIHSGMNLGLMGWFGASTGLVSWSPQDAQEVQDGQSTEAAESDAKTEQEAAPAKKDPPRLVTINGGRSKLNAAHWPLVGQTDAEKILVEMFDYTCPHCRENHKSVKGAMDQLGSDKLSIVALCVPMNSRCNGSIQVTDAKHAEACDLAKLSIAVWLVDPVVFQEFHEWMFTGNHAPSYSTALARANSMVDQAKLAKQLNGKVAGQYVTKQVQLYQMLGAGTVPKLLLPQSTVSGKVGSPSALIQIVNRR